MKRMVCLTMLLLLLTALFAGCFRQENPPTVHVVYEGVLYEIEDYPDETTACALEDKESCPCEPVEATVIPFDVLPTREGEVNVNAQSVWIYDWDESYFLVVIDGEQYIVDR